MLIFLKPDFAVALYLFSHPGLPGPLEKLLLELSFQDFASRTLGEFAHCDILLGHLEGG
jgi:hypothetical protein